MKKKHYKVPRGQFEEQQLREERHDQNLKAVMIVLPIVMVAVLLVGLYFGYKSYLKNAVIYTGATNSQAYRETVGEENEMLLRVVNPSSPLDASYVPTSVRIEGVSVCPELKEPLERLLSDAKDAGLHLVLQSGYISYEEQKRLFDTAMNEYKKSAKVSTVRAESYVRRTIPKAGECEQQTGLCVTFTSESEEKFETTPEYAWLSNNAPSYGFVLRYPESENAGGMAFSSHLFRYVGVDNAYFMRALDMNFDEYADYCAYH